MGKRVSTSYWSLGAAGPALDGAAADWRARARCRETDPDSFFPDFGEDATVAKKVCRACPVRTECLLQAFATDEQWGVWGGLTDLERRRLKRHAA